MELLEERRYSVLAEPEWNELLRMSGVSPAYLRQILRKTGLPMSVLVEGVRQTDLGELERTLLALESEYRASERPGRQACRAAVIAARDRARFVARNPKTPESKRNLKQEMILWMQVWLENPGAFPNWVTLRKRVLGCAPKPPAIEFQSTRR
jgi:hypothetical protein